MLHKNTNTIRPENKIEPQSPPNFRFCKMNMENIMSRQKFSPAERMLERSNLTAKRSHDHLHWSVIDENVPTLPFMYFLQPTHVIISTLKPSSIASNIENCLKRLSITADFDNTRMIANAQTCNQINFNIRLFSSKNKSNDQKTIVELNRLSSCQFGFHKVVCAILQSAAGKSVAMPDAQHNCKRRKVCKELIPRSSTKSQRDDAISALDRALALLSKDRYDANALGMKSLLFLTDKQNSGEEMASIAAKLILSEGADTLGSLQRKLFRLIAFGTMDENETMEIGSNQFSTTHHQQMRMDALNVLLQSLEIFSSNSPINSFDTFCSEMWLQDDITTALLNDLLKAELEPHGSHIAYIAMKCLRQLISNSSIAHNRIIESGANAEYVLQKAIDVGMNRYELLAIEGKKFMTSLEAR